MVTVQKIIHHNKTCILLKCSYNEFVLQKIKNLPGCKYSRTHKSWYIPYEKENWHYFTQTGLPFIIESSGTTDSTTSMRENTGKNPAEVPNSCTEKAADTQNISVNFRYPYFFLRGISNEAQIHVVKSIKNSYWNPRFNNWVIPANRESLQTLVHPLEFISKELSDQWIQVIDKIQDPQTCYLYKSPEFPAKILVQLSGQGIDVDFLKHVPERSFHKEKKFWVIPDDKKLVERIVDHYVSLKVRVVNKTADNRYDKHNYTYGEYKKYLLSKISGEFLTIVEKYIDTLIRERYSRHTLKEYVSLFHQFLAYQSPKTIQMITESDVNAYLTRTGNEKVSESYMNGQINAIKFYYQKVEFNPDFKIERIKRPRKSTLLPKVLSIQQVDAMLRATGNLKHTAILYAIYGHGLRLNELLSLRIEDIFWDRNQIFIHSGKGKKDRYLQMSIQFKTLLKSYVHAYMPAFWIFEGQDEKSKYSERSVQAVVKVAARKAGIKQRVTPHTLRHCYATHLLDSGTQLPYIKELLGHKDIKTTMIYTHVTTASIENVISPLDRLRQANNNNPESL